MQLQLEDHDSSLGQNDNDLIVRFDPPAYLQRRAFVLKTLKSLDPKCRKLLDVGTGDGGLLSFLVRCDDDLPITTMVGIDIDRTELELARLNTKPTRIHHEDLRWRPLEIAIYEGGVADLDGVPGSFDCITAIEVLEHMDPVDVEAFTQRCLGRLQPRCFIVTTPNRDFNQVFARLRQQSKHVYQRKGIGYVMRHSDHRFEMSQQEFQAWADVQCRLYKYQARFEGIGTIENAFAGQKNWREIFPEAGSSNQFGCSSQAAIFTRIEEPSEECELSSNIGESSLSKNLHLIARYEYPWTDCEDYPPSQIQIMHIVAEAEAYFRPLYDAQKNYSKDENCEVVVDCKEFFEICHAMQRAARYHIEVFLACVKTMLDKEIPGENVTEDQGSTSEASEGLEHEPAAICTRAAFRTTDAGELILTYTFDISSFALVQNRLQKSDESLNIVESDWNWSLDSRVIETVQW